MNERGEGSTSVENEKKNEWIYKNCAKINNICTCRSEINTYTPTNTQSYRQDGSQICLDIRKKPQKYMSRKTCSQVSYIFK
jgi:hypothetical protein